MAAAKIRVLCVDDHHIVREGVALIINGQQDMEVVGSAASAEEAVALFRRHKPDVTLMDLRLGGSCGVQAIRTIRAEAPHARIVALTMYQGDEDIYSALDAGAAAYLLKDTISDDLIRVVRAVHAGEQPSLNAGIRARLSERSTRPPLTAREQQVLELVSLGMRNKEVAAALAISEETAQVHVKNILAKLEAKDRTAAVNIALRRGIIHMR